MKTKNFFTGAITMIAALFLFVSTALSQYQERSYDVRCNNISGDDYGRSIVNRVDGGYAIGGYSYNPVCGIGPFDWMFVRLQPTGVHQDVRYIGTAADDKCYSLIQVKSDTGYVLAGDMYQIPGQKAATFVKLNKNALLSFSRKIDDTVGSQYNQVIADGNNRWAFTGWQERQYRSTKVRKIIATQYFNSGVMNWGYRYDSYLTATALSASHDEGVSVCYQSAGGPSYGVAVKTNRFAGNAGWDIMIVKLNYLGNVVWNKIYRFNMQTNPYPSATPTKIIPMSDGGFTVVGYTSAFGGQNDIIVLRVNSTGGIVWSNTYGTTAAVEYGNSIVQDGSYFVITGGRKQGVANPDALIMKIPNAGGAALWTKLWDTGNSGTDIGYDIINSTVSAATGYAITGNTTRGASANNSFLWRTNDDGQLPGMNCQDSVILQQYTNPHKLDSMILVKRQLKECPFNPAIVAPGMVTATYCLSFAPTQDPTGYEENDNLNTGEVTTYALKQNFPNPFNPVTKIQFELPVSGNVELRVFDISGREVMTLFDGTKPQGRHEIEFNGEQLSSGVYYYKIISGSFSDIKKMMLLK